MTNKTPMEIYEQSDDDEAEGFSEKRFDEMVEGLARKNEKQRQRESDAKRTADKYISQDGGSPKVDQQTGDAADDQVSEQTDDADADDESDTDKDESRERKSKPKQADILIALANDDVTLFHSPAPDDEAFADIIINGHRESHRVRGRIFKGWLRHRYFELTGSGCNSEALQVATDTIEAKARYKGPAIPVHIRIAGSTDDAIYIDLGDPDWRAIRVTAKGWQTIDEPPVRFTRSPSTKPLPIPETGGSIWLFRRFCNLKKPPKGKTDSEFVVLIGHILAVFRPNASYPVFVALGEHGSCKSTLSTLIGRLTDPRSPEQRSPPSSEEDLLVTAKSAHVLPYDNLSHLSDWLSDAFCRLSTGGGAGKRKLFTDTDEILFEGRRAIFLTGIEDFVTRPDLVDRSNMFNHEIIKDKDRLSDDELEALFQRDAGKILGALLDGVSAALRNLPSIKITEKPRMADFAIWAEAGTRSYWKANTFMAAHRDKLAAAIEVVLEASPVGAAVRRFIGSHDQWTGTAQQLLDELVKLVSERATKEKEWPKGANALSGKLKRAAPALRKIGIHVSWSREGHEGERTINIVKRAKPDRPKTSSASSASPATTTEQSEISSLGGNGADDPGPFADDPPHDIVSNKSLINKPANDADDADDVFAHRSENDDDTSRLTISGKSDLEAAYDELRLRGDWPPHGITAGSSL